VDAEKGRVGCSTGLDLGHIGQGFREKLQEKLKVRSDFGHEDLGDSMDSILEPRLARKAEISAG